MVYLINVIDVTENHWYIYNTLALLLLVLYWTKPIYIY